MTNYCINKKKAHALCLRINHVYEKKIKMWHRFLIREKFYLWLSYGYFIYLILPNMWSNCMSLPIICHHQGELNYPGSIVSSIYSYNAWFIKHFLIFKSDSLPDNKCKCSQPKISFPMNIRKTTFPIWVTLLSVGINEPYFPSK